MSFFRKHPVITAIIALVFVIVLVFATLGKRDITPIESIVGNVATPVSSGLSRFTQGVGNWFRTVFGMNDLQRQNVELQEKLAQLESETAVLRELQLENARWKEMANYVDENTQYEIVSACVAGKNPGFWFDSFTINKGRKDGLLVGNAVIDRKGALVGRLSEVGGNWSKVQSIIDPKSQISAIVERTRDYVMVRGTVNSEDGNLCEVYFIPIDKDLQPGDNVLSNRISDIPKGLLIGKITMVGIEQDSTESKAVLEPAVNFSTLEEVMVIVDAHEEVEP